MIEFIAGCFIGVFIAKKVRLIADWKAPKNIKIVRMKKDVYAIRKLTFFGYQFLDLKGDFWWSTEKYIPKNCFGTLQQCKDNFEDITLKGEPIEI